MNRIEKLKFRREWSVSLINGSNDFRDRKGNGVIQIYFLCIKRNVYSWEWFIKEVSIQETDLILRRSAKHVRHMWFLQEGLNDLTFFLKPHRYFLSQNPFLFNPHRSQLSTFAIPWLTDSLRLCVVPTCVATLVLQWRDVSVTQLNVNSGTSIVFQKVIEFLRAQISIDNFDIYAKQSGETKKGKLDQANLLFVRQNGGDDHFRIFMELESLL